MDAAYLKSSVGGVLSAALAIIASQQPEDPIEFLALYLKKHGANTSARSTVGDHAALLRC